MNSLQGTMFAVLITVIGSILMLIDAANNNFTKLALDSTMFITGTYFTGLGFIVLWLLTIYKLLNKQPINWKYLVVGTVFGIIIPYCVFIKMSTV